MNRTCTSFGKNKLAEWLQEPLEKKEEIRERQIAVSELAGYDKFRECFRITGLLYKGEAMTETRLRNGRNLLLISAECGGASYALPCAFGQHHPTGTRNDRSDFNELVRACVRYFCGGKLRAYQTRHKPARDIRQKAPHPSIYAKLIALIDRQEMKAPCSPASKQSSARMEKELPKY